jgi:hypothetical protein
MTGEVSFVHGGSVPTFSGQIELDQSSWTAGSDPDWPLIVRVNIDYCLRADHGDTQRVDGQPSYYCEDIEGQTTYAAWGFTPNASYSSDRRTISVPKPKAGETLYLDIVAAGQLPPYSWPGYGDTDWPTLTVKSKVSVDPWYFEVSGANLPGNDQYRAEGILGIVSADSPLVLTSPPEWLISAAKGGNQVWSGLRNWTYEGGMTGDTGGQESFDMELYLTRDYPDVVFEENQDTIYTHRWEKLRSTGTTLHLVKGNAGGPSPTPSIAPPAPGMPGSGSAVFSGFSPWERDSEWGCNPRVQDLNGSWEYVRVREIPTHYGSNYRGVPTGIPLLEFKRGSIRALLYFDGDILSPAHFEDGCNGVGIDPSGETMPRQDGFPGDYTITYNGVVSN